MNQVNALVDIVMDELEDNHQEHVQEQVQEEELDDYDVVPCQGCGDSMARDDVNQYRLGWWCSRYCAFHMEISNMY